MKKIIFIFCFFCSFSFMLYSASSHAVPLENNSYKIISNAEIKGIIKPQSQIKPYTVDEVLSLLNEILLSGRISDNEITIIKDTIALLEKNYGNENVITFKDILKNGFFRTGNDNINVLLGVDISSDSYIGKSTDNNKIIIDSRNRVNFNIRGDAFSFLSYDINIAAFFNKIDTRLYSYLDFKLSGQGNYFYFPSFGATSNLDNSLGALVSIGAVPVLRMNFLNNKLKFVIGSSVYEWGPGVHNLSVSSTATEMPGLEISVKPFEWIEYSVMHASLTRFSLKRYDGFNWPSDNWSTKLGKYDNMFSIHRLDFSFFNFNFALYESVIWRKRLELAYLNPISIYEVAQNELGDFDNMIVGLDMSYIIKNIGKIYFGLSIDEMSSLDIKNFFSHPRHIFGVQFGMDFNAIFGSFSNFYFQTTYIAPFYGSHYEILKENNPWGGTNMMTQPVQRGRLIGYPLHPDSFELLLGYSTIFPHNITFDFTIRDQMRSAQFTVNDYGDSNSGTNIYTIMNYSNSDEYANKKFFDNIWKNTLLIDANATKSFSDLPLDVSVGLKLSMDWERSYNLTDAVKPVTYSYSYGDSHNEYVNGTYNPDDGSYLEGSGKYNPGTGVTYGEWKLPNIMVAGGISFKVYL